MTSVTIATHPTPKLVAGIVSIITPDIKAPWLWDMIGYIASQFPYLSSKDVSGYVYFFQNQTIPGSNDTTAYAGMGAELMVCISNRSLPAGVIASVASKFFPRG